MCQVKVRELNSVRSGGSVCYTGIYVHIRQIYTMIHDLFQFRFVCLGSEKRGCQTLKERLDHLDRICLK